MTRQQIQVQVMICPETLNTVVIILILEWRPQSRHLGMCRRQVVSCWAPRPHKQITGLLSDVRTLPVILSILQQPQPYARGQRRLIESTVRF